MKNCLFLLLSLCLLSTIVHATGDVTGYVKNTSSVGISDATVFILDQDGDVVDSALTETGAYAGRYTVTGLAAATYDLRVYPYDTYAYRHAEDVVVVNSQTTTENFYNVALQGKITGVVKDSSQTALSDITVTATHSDGVVILSGTSDEDGIYSIERLPAGTFVVSGVDADYGFALTTGVSVTAGGTTEDIDLVGEEGGVSGTVTRSDETTAIAGALVSIYDSSDDIIATDTTDSSGDYELKYFASGTYKVQVLSEGNIIGSDDSVVISGTIVTEDFTETSCGSISGTVSDGSQDPINAAIVRAVGLSSSSAYSYETTTDSSGDYSFATAHPGTYSINVVASSYCNEATDDITLVADQDITSQDFTLAGNPGQISGTVTDSAEDPIEGVLVFVVPSGESAAVLHTTTDASGDFTIHYLPADTYKVYAQIGGYATDTTSGVTVTSGQSVTGKDFELATTGGSITGTVYESDGVTPIANAGVVCSSDSSSFGITQADSNGEYTFELILPGTYAVTACAEGFVEDTATNIVVTGTQENSGNDFSLDAE